MKQTLLDGSRALGFPLSDAQAELCCAFSSRMLRKNEVMNLTAITDPKQVASLHFLDSLALLHALAFSGQAVIDVGCGAGFPGVPLLIAQPDIRLTLLDSQRKRISWLSEVLEDLQLSASCVCARAEDFASDHREQYDIAVSRAVARLNILAELALPLVKTGGHFIAMKSVDSDAELSEAARAIRLLGGSLAAAEDYPVPYTDVSHRLIVIRKDRPTPKTYPRRFSKIKQNPL